MLRGIRQKRSKVKVIIISGSCCIPGMAPFDEAAERVVKQVVGDLRIEADVRVVPASNAMFGALPKKVMNRLIKEANTGKMPVPAVLVNGEIVSYGVPAPEALKEALAGHYEKSTKEEQ